MENLIEQARHREYLRKRIIQLKLDKMMLSMYDNNPVTLKDYLLSSTSTLSYYNVRNFISR